MPSVYRIPTFEPARTRNELIEIRRDYLLLARVARARAGAKSDAPDRAIFAFDSQQRRIARCGHAGQLINGTAGTYRAQPAYCLQLCPHVRSHS